MTQVGDLVPSPKSVVAAAELREALTAAGVDEPQRVISPGGEIHLHWVRDGVDVEVYVEADGSVSFWYDGPKLTELLAAALGDSRDTSDDRVIERINMAYCPECDLQMYRDTLHPHPLTPVQVTVTEDLP